MALSDVIKKGAGAPLAGDLIVGGIGVDSANGKIYIKKDDLTITSPGGTATETANIPAGNIVATNVQEAINELDAEKINVSNIGVTVQAYDIALDAVSGTNSGDQIASTVPNTPSGNIVSTDVQSALNELDSGKVNTSDIGTTVQAYDADLDTVASVGVGTGANQIVQLDASAKLPAIDGSQLTGISSSSGIDRPVKTSTNVINVNGTDLTVPSPVAGTDYYFSLTAITTSKQLDTIGGFHYSLTPAVETPTGNKTTADITAIAGINEYSIWTDWFRPTCDPEGMVHINGRWYDIYLLNSEHIANGSSKAGATIAGGALSQGREYPKIPIAFGGDGSTNYGKLTWFQAAEIAASHGKSLISYAEFPSIAYGVAEQTDAELLDGGLANIEHYPTLTSKFGIEQATGVQNVWGADVGGNRSENSTAWAWRTGLTDNRGDIYALHNNHVTAVLFGGRRGYGVYVGSRASNWYDYVWYSGWHVGVRLACDHMLIK